MLLSLPFLVLSLAVAASANHFADGSHNLIRRHAHHARAPVSEVASPLKKRKSCRPKPSGKTPTSTKKEEPAKTTKKAETTKPAQQQNNGSKDKPNTDKPNTDKPITGGNNGLISVGDGHCGNPGATSQITPTTGPNGAMYWLTCGIEAGGWNPPHVTVDELKVVDLTEALKSGDSPFKACAPYVGMFYKYAGQFGLKPIMLASFAMQESGCNPNTVGGGGEQGMMQLTQEKCGGAPGGNCKDPDFNIRTAARYFADVLNNNWRQRLTVQKATAARYSACCRCQNNLDYIFQYVNGWCQNINAYAHSLGKYHNLDVC
ncbi:lysozyme-like protein [Mycena rebaudengoi]|nr:lysozyme-like protein [Mycena rebaudengoi]